jgi:hypothetical protein
VHPYFAQELARERRNELLRQQQFRQPKRSVSAAAGAQKAPPIARARHSLGRALVALGTRLLGGGPATIELSTPRR